VTQPERPLLADVLDDLAAEHADLDTVVAASLDRFDAPTPAEGWSVGDTVSHLAFFDERAAVAVSRPDEFRDSLTEVLANPTAFIDAGPHRGRALPAEDVLAWWREARTATLEVFGAADPSTRVPWYGPDMNLVSFATARLMETWAHGQDVADAVGVRRTPTSRLRHIAHLGVRTMGFSFASNELPMPTDPVRVELAAPDGSTWSWGPPDAADAVRGSALGFALLVSQRRNITDIDVVAVGPVATAWVGIAQCFAGPSGGGRAPGLPTY